MEAVSVSVENRRLSAITVTYVIAGLLIVEIGMFAWFGVLNRDEGWYLNAARAVFEGKVPYRDFNYFQPPVLPYVYGLPQWLFGPSVLTGRIESVAFTLAGVAALVRSARIMGGASAGAWTLALLAVDPSLLYYSSLARSEGLTLMLCAVALLCFLRYRDGLRGLLFAPALLFLAAGVREPLLPAAVIATAYIWWRAAAGRQVRAIAAVLLAGELAIICVPVLLSLHDVVFNLWSSQVFRGTQWAATENNAPVKIQERIDWIYRVWLEFAVVIVAALAVCASAAMEWRRGWRPRWRRADPMSSYLLVAAFALLLFLPFTAATPFEARYFVPTSGLLVAVVAGALFNDSPRADGEASGAHFPMLVAIVAVAVAPYYAVLAQQFLLPRDPHGQLNGAADFIASQMRSGDELLTLDPVLATEANVKLTPGLEMGQFSYWPRMPLASADRHGVFDRDRMVWEIEGGRPKVIALTDMDSGLIGPILPHPVRSAQYTGPPLIVMIQLGGRYVLRKTVADYGLFHENLYILVRRT